VNPLSVWTIEPRGDSSVDIVEPGATVMFRLSASQAQAIVAAHNDFLGDVSMAMQVAGIATPERAII
jgi:hypothetical protein